MPDAEIAALEADLRAAQLAADIAALDRLIVRSGVDRDTPPVR